MLIIREIVATVVPNCCARFGILSGSLDGMRILNGYLAFAAAYRALISFLADSSSRSFLPAMALSFADLNEWIPRQLCKGKLLARFQIGQDFLFVHLLDGDLFDVFVWDRKRLRNVIADNGVGK